jgi:toxin ParE2
MTLRLLAPAQDELDEAMAWYAAQAPDLDKAFLFETLKVFRLIQQFPLAWHPLGEGIRRCRLARFPYGVIYAPEGDDILVLAISHLHRAPGHWKQR